VGAEVEIGARTRLMANLYIEGPTVIGEDNVFFPFSSVGVASQDMKYKGERAFTRIGSRNRVREFVTIHRGTEGGGLVTSIGDDCLLMTYAHVAHDCRIGNHVILGNSVGLAGHVTIEDWADVSPFSGVHQFCRIGRHAFVGPYSVIKQDVMPYSLTSHQPEVQVFGANAVGSRAAVSISPSSNRCRPPCACSRAPDSIPRRRWSAFAPKCGLPRDRRTARIHRFLRARCAEGMKVRDHRRQRTLPRARA